MLRIQETKHKLTGKQIKRLTRLQTRKSERIRGIWLRDMMKHISSKKTMVEIGCYAGLSTVTFAEHFKRVYAVDPWINDYDKNDKSSYAYPMSIIEAIFRERAKRYPNIKILKIKSTEAIGTIEDLSLDFVYIDATHTYDSVKQDIQNWLPKIKDNGFIGGHDFCQRWHGVMEAVKELVGQPQIVFKDTSWLKLKNKCST